MTFQNKVKEHLGDYKKTALNILQDGIYKYDGKEIPYKHILPKKQYKQNILEPYRQQFFESTYSNIDYHRYFHHLNSSQALCINFFFPFIEENKFDVILDLLHLRNKTVSKMEFEFVSDIEKSNSRKTNFDFFFEMEGNKRVYVEVKYTEQEFGSAKIDASHFKKFNDTYYPLLERNKFIKDNYKSQEFFLSNYQIMRNLVHINSSSYVVFLFPQANKKVLKQATFAKNKILTEEGAYRFKLLTLEKATSEISKRIDSDKLIKYFKDFDLKYLNY